VRVETSAGHDRLVVEFDRAVPTYALRVNPGGTHFTGSASGAPIVVAGSVGLLLHVEHLDLPNRYPHGGDIATGYPAVEEVRVVGDFEGSVELAIGLTRGVCPTVSTAAGPPRLVVDFPSG
jgi:hypothetical protein